MAKDKQVLIPIDDVTEIIELLMVLCKSNEDWNIRDKCVEQCKKLHLKKLKTELRSYYDNASKTYSDKGLELLERVNRLTVNASK